MNLNFNILGRLNRGASIPWYLGDGLVPESTSYIVYDPLQASSLANSYVNLANPGTNDALVGVAPTLPDGWSFNGTTQYLDGRGSFGASKTLIVWFENMGATGVYGCGDSKLLVRNYLSPGNTRLTLQSNTDLVGDTQCGILGLRANYNVFRNTKKLTQTLAAFPAGTNYPIFIGARNNSGSPLQYGGGKVYRYALYDIALSDAQIQGVMDAMIADVNPAASSYEATMLASNPLVYFPCNNSKGSFMLDKVSNIGAQSAVFGPTAGGDGPTGKGKAMVGGSTAASSYCQALDQWPVAAGVDLDEFSVAFWIKNVNANTQARPCNIYSNSAAEYLAVEIRSGNIAIYFDDTGAVWNTGTLASTTNNTWQHVVAYRSTIAQEAGIYLNSTKYAASWSGSAGAYTTGTPDNYYPFLVQSMTGSMSHIAFYDHAVSQALVDSIYV